MKIRFQKIIAFSFGLCIFSRLFAVEHTWVPGDTVTIVAVGDIMMGTDYPSRAYLPPDDDCRPLLAYVREFLLAGDITFGNLEGCLGGSDVHAKRCENCYAFRMPETYAACLAEAGFDILSLANNHTLDFGLEGYRNTVRMLEIHHIQGLGYRDKPSLIIQSKGLLIGFVAFTYNPMMCDIRDIAQASRLVTSLKDKTDLIVVSFHGGAEGSGAQHVPKHTEFYLGENRGDVYKFAHAVVDAGADLVLGHGPHVPRAIEYYQGRLIVYSLGNFCTYKRFNLNNDCGIAPIFIVNMNRYGNLISGRIIPVFQERPGLPVIDPEKRAISRIRKLMLADFPETPLEITDHGEIKIQEKISY